MMRKNNQLDSYKVPETQIIIDQRVSREHDALFYNSSEKYVLVYLEFRYSPPFTENNNLLQKNGWSYSFKGP